jgi:hypothetical protein
LCVTVSACVSLNSFMNKQTNTSQTALLCSEIGVGDLKRKYTSM